MMNNNSRKVFVINNFDSQEPKYSSIFKQDVGNTGKIECKINLRVMYQGNLNSANMNQSKSLLLLLSN